MNQNTRLSKVRLLPLHFCLKLRMDFLEITRQAAYRNSHRVILGCEEIHCVIEFLQFRECFVEALSNVWQVSGIALKQASFGWHIFDVRVDGGLTGECAAGRFFEAHIAGGVAARGVGCQCRFLRVPASYSINRQAPRLSCFAFASTLPVLPDPRVPVTFLLNGKSPDL